MYIFDNNYLQLLFMYIFDNNYLQFEALILMIAFANIHSLITICNCFLNMELYISTGSSEI